MADEVRLVAMRVAPGTGRLIPAQSTPESAWERGITVEEAGRLWDRGYVSGDDIGKRANEKLAGTLAASTPELDDDKEGG